MNAKLQWRMRKGATHNSIQDYSSEGLTQPDSLNFPVIKKKLNLNLTLLGLSLSPLRVHLLDFWMGKLWFQGVDEERQEGEESLQTGWPWGHSRLRILQRSPAVLQITEITNKLTKGREGRMWKTQIWYKITYRNPLGIVMSLRPNGGVPRCRVSLTWLADWTKKVFDFTNHKEMGHEKKLDHYWLEIKFLRRNWRWPQHSMSRTNERNQRTHEMEMEDESLGKWSTYIS